MRWLQRRTFLAGLLGAGGTAIASQLLPQSTQAQGLFRRPTQFFIATDGSDRNPGTVNRPWASLHHASQRLKPGDALFVRGGTYAITTPIVWQSSGTDAAWITIQNYPGETPIIDANLVEVGPWGVGDRPYPPEQGALLIDQQHHLRVIGLTIVRSHSAGIAVRRSHHIDVFGNTTRDTFSCGVLFGAGFPVLESERCHHLRAIGNTIVGANNPELQWLKPDEVRRDKGAHEALSVGAVDHFELAYNEISHCDKELIDCKDSSRHGYVHHNYLHNGGSQGIYVDCYFERLGDLEIAFNFIKSCKTGIALAAEGGPLMENIHLHHNIITDNLGSGILFGRWHNDNLRKDIFIENNTIHHNGYGQGESESPYWVTGGIYFYSTNIQNVVVKNNIFSVNKYFDIGYSDDYLDGGEKLQEITLQNNAFHRMIQYANPTYLDWPEKNVHAIDGDGIVFADPPFADANISDFRILSESLAASEQSPNSDQIVGAVAPTDLPIFWWATHFPPDRNWSQFSAVEWRDEMG
jgi:hypothetical protein